MRVLPRGSEVFVGFVTADGVQWQKTKTEFDIDLRQIIVFGKGYNWTVLEIDEFTRMQIDPRDVIDTADIKE